MDPAVAVGVETCSDVGISVSESMLRRNGDSTRIHVVEIKCWVPLCRTPVFIYVIVLVLTRAIVCREVGDSLFRFLIELKFLRHLLPRCEEG